MALTAQHKETTFGVGDKVKVFQKIKEGDKTRSQAFEGMVIGIKGRGENKSFTVRKIGVGQIGIERIYPLFAPTIEKIEVKRKGTRGVRRAKLYYTRDKPKREIEKIYARAASREEAKKDSQKPVRKASRKTSSRGKLKIKKRRKSAKSAKKST